MNRLFSECASFSKNLLSKVEVISKTEVNWGLQQLLYSQWEECYESAYKTGQEKIN